MTRDVTSRHAALRSARRTASIVLIAIFAVLLPAASPARASSDDYPWPYAAQNVSDPFGFTERQCTSYAAWRMYKAGHRFNNRTYYGGHYYYWGNATNWAATAVAVHKTVTTHPKVGAIAQWKAYEKSAYYTSKGVGTIQAGSLGHVAYVAYVYSDGSVLVRQYNLFGSRAYSTMHVRAPRYIYFY